MDTVGIECQGKVVPVRLCVIESPIDVDGIRSLKASAEFFCSRACTLSTSDFIDLTTNFVSVFLKSRCHPLTKDGT